MNTATPVIAFVPTAEGYFDGIRWIQFSMDTETYEEFKGFPRVVRYDGMLFQKMSYNSDKHTISYRAVSQVATPA